MLPLNTSSVASISFGHPAVVDLSIFVSDRGRTGSAGPRHCLLHLPLLLCDTVSQIVDSSIACPAHPTKCPDIGVDNIGIFVPSFTRPLCDGCTALLCMLLTLSHKLCIREVFLRCDRPQNPHSHLGRCNHQKFSHIMWALSHM